MDFDVTSIENRLNLISETLDTYLGDTDPVFDDDMTDDDIRNEEPIFWVCKEINAILQEMANKK